jgi:hypothetical protein
MSDRAKHGGNVWFVRGVPAELRTEVADAAKRAGMKVGAWVERALRAGLNGPGIGPGSAGDLAALAKQVEQRGERLDSLCRLFEEQEKVVADALARLEALEGQVSAASRPSLARSDRTPLDTVKPEKGAEIPVPPETAPELSGDAGEVFATGGNETRRRLTKLGVAEAIRMIQAGDADVDIARRLGVERGAIRQRRKTLERAALDQSA